MQIQPNPSNLTIFVETEAETDRLGRVMAEVLRPGMVVGLIGPLGAGKTRLSRAIAEALGVDPKAIGSPTFGLIHEYEGSLPVYHFDTYRLNSIDEFDALGAEDYWSAGGICLVEWADRVADRLPLDAWMVLIEPSESGRLVSIQALPEIRDAIAMHLREGSG